MERPMVAGITAAQSCGTGVCHTSREVTHGEPDEPRSCPKHPTIAWLLLRQPTLGPSSANSDHVWPCGGQRWRQPWMEIVAKSDQHWSMRAMCWPTFGQLSANKVGPKSAKVRRKWPDAFLLLPAPPPEDFDIVHDDGEHLQASGSGTTTQLRAHTTTCSGPGWLTCWTTSWTRRPVPYDGLLRRTQRRRDDVGDADPERGRDEGRLRL